MGSRLQMTEGGTPWLESDVNSIDDVKALITRAVKLDMKKEAFLEGWHQQKEQYEQKTGKKLKLGGSSSRGPATMATSILGTVNTCLFIMDYPEIMDDFFAVLSDKLIEYHYALMDATDNHSREGYSINDDNCYLFPPAQYLRFCAPVVERLFKEFAPEPHHRRSQHSDSNMGHLMEILSDLGVNSVNLGPSLHPLKIRKAIPKAVIVGQIPPFTLRNGSPEDIIRTVRRDIESVGQDGGLIECPAGSVAVGTPLENLKIYMWAVINFQRDYGLIIDGIAVPQTQNALYGTASVMTASVSRGEARSTKVQNDIYWLARIIHAEARGEPYLGKVAVGNVILNRVKSSGFPNTIYNVIFEYSGSIPQFSPVADGCIYNTPNGESYRAAEEAYNGSKPVGDALFFFNPSKAQGSWIVKNRRYMTTIGNHAFYY
jgi:uroporphyrinogen decarboxylase